MTELRTCHHEAGHGVVAYRLAQPIRLVSVRPATTYAGVMLGGSSASLDSAGFDPFRPAIVQPARARRRIEGDICVSLAGVLGEDLLLQPSGYVPTPPDEVAAKEMALKLSGLSRKDGERLAALEVDPTPVPHDEESAATAAWALAGREAAALLNYLRSVTRSIVEADSDHIHALAEALHERTVMSGRQVRTFLRERGVRQWH